MDAEAMRTQGTAAGQGRPVAPAERRPDLARVETQVLGVAGAGLLALAGYFLWRELQLAPEVVLLLGTAGAAGGALGLRRLRVPLVGPLLLLGATVLGGLWYGASREPLLLGGLGVCFGASAFLALAELGAPGPAEGVAGRWHRLLSWHGAALAGLASSFALYFHLFDASVLGAGLQAFVARRALLSLGWLVAGVGLVLWGRGRRATEVRDAGFLVVAAAVAKLLVYDATHLDGFLRIGALAVAGGLLVASAAWVRRLHQGVR